MFLFHLVDSTLAEGFCSSWVWMEQKESKEWSSWVGSGQVRSGRSESGYSLVRSSVSWLLKVGSSLNCGQRKTQVVTQWRWARGGSFGCYAWVPWKCPSGLLLHQRVVLFLFGKWSLLSAAFESSIYLLIILRARVCIGKCIQSCQRYLFYCFLGGEIMCIRKFYLLSRMYYERKKQCYVFT